MQSVANKLCLTRKKKRAANAPQKTRSSRVQCGTPEFDPVRVFGSAETGGGTATAARVRPRVEDDLQRVHDAIATKESWDKLFTKKPSPVCDGHGEPAKRLVTKKKGGNCGRAFWVCARFVQFKVTRGFLHLVLAHESSHLLTRHASCL